MYLISFDSLKSSPDSYVREFVELCVALDSVKLERMIRRLRNRGKGGEKVRGKGSEECSSASLPSYNRNNNNGHHLIIRQREKARQAGKKKVKEKKQENRTMSDV